MVECYMYNAYVYVCACMCVHACVCMCVVMCVCVCQIRVCVCVCTCVMCVYMCHMCVCAYVHVCVCVCLYISVCVHVLVFASPHSITPVETLHTILLGACKYTVRRFMSSGTPLQMEEILSRIAAFPYSGFTVRLVQV